LAPYHSGQGGGWVVQEPDGPSVSSCRASVTVEVPRMIGVGTSAPNGGVNVTQNVPPW